MRLKLNKKKIFGSLFILFIAVFCVVFCDKYNTRTLIKDQQKLNQDQTEELARKSIIICSDKFDKSNTRALKVDQSDNIYTLTYNSSFEATLAYAKYSLDKDIIYCEYDEALQTSDVNSKQKDSDKKMIKRKIAELPYF